MKNKIYVQIKILAQININLIQYCLYRGNISQASSFGTTVSQIVVYSVMRYTGSKICNIVLIRFDKRHVRKTKRVRNIVIRNTEQRAVHQTWCIS